MSKGGCDVVVVADDDEVEVVSPMRIKSLYDCVCSSMSMASVRAGAWAGVGRGRRNGFAAARWKVPSTTRQVQKCNRADSMMSTQKKLGDN